MADQLRASFATMEQAYGEGEGAEQFAITAWSMMIGAMTIARVLGDDPRSDRVLALVRKSLLEMEVAGKRRMMDDWRWGVRAVGFREMRRSYGPNVRSCRGTSISFSR
jgi:hypothetical protein